MTTLSSETLRLFEDLNRKQLELEANIPTLKSINELSLQQELSTSLRNGVKELAKQIEDLKQLADEQDRERDREAILQRLQRNEDQLKQLQVSMRRAILTSKRAIEEEARLQLLEHDGDGRKAGDAYELRRRNVTSGDAVMRATDDITKTLQRTAQLMQQEIERSAYSAKVLDESTKTLKTTYSEYRGFNAVVRGSKQLITKLEQSDWTDRLLILFGLLVFILVVLYILKKRVWNTGIGWVTWFTSWII